jgi:nitrite reductase/ring-hydroxylating ferredoxin subunit/uncharacterized membrane protein
MQPGTLLHRVTEQTERLSALDKLAGPLARTADRALRQARLKHILSGSWLGHPLHPLATDVVIGSWTMAAILDLRRGDDSVEAAKTLVGVGVLAALPTAASGISDWADTRDPRARRMGLVHAASNVVALALNASSYLERRRGRRAAGALLTAASAAPLTIGGFLGAHMAYARGIGVSRTAFDERIAEWAPLDSEAALGGGWSEANVRGLPVLAWLGQAHAARVVAATCTHCGARLRPNPRAGDALCCPADGSAFRADDGAVLKGPATTPIPRFEARPAAGDGVEVRSPS